MPTKGSCLCGTSTFNIKDEPAMTCICHCLSCRKLTGSTYSTAWLLPEDSFELTSKLSVKSVTVEHEIGMPMHLSFCGDCGTALCKTADADMFRNMVIVFTGTLDDGGEALNKAPQAELWTKYRADWTGKVGSGKMKQCNEFT